MAVSRVYRQRHEDQAVALSAPKNEPSMRGMGGPEIEHVTGFGCLLVRRSVLSQLGLSGDDKTWGFFDVNIGVNWNDTAEISGMGFLGRWGALVRGFVGNSCRYDNGLIVVASRQLSSCAAALDPHLCVPIECGRVPSGLNYSHERVQRV